MASIFKIGNGRFALGTVGELAIYVVAVKGKNITGVRGRRPLLTKGRYKKVSGTAEMKAAFRVALS